MPPEASNSHLVARALQGDASATEQLVRRHLRAAVAVALAVLGEPTEAEDVAQEAFLIAFERLETCREPERFAGWLMQIVRHRALNSRVRQRLQGTVTHQLPSPELEQAPPDALRLELRTRLLQGLSTLSAPQREVVLLHDLEGWTHREIGEALGFSEGMSRQHLFTARRVLRALLGEVAPSGEGHEG